MDIVAEANFRKLVDREFKERLEMNVISRGREMIQKLIYNG